MIFLTINQYLFLGISILQERIEGTEVLLGPGVLQSVLPSSQTVNEVVKRRKSIGDDSGGFNLFFFNFVI